MPGPTPLPADGSLIALAQTLARVEPWYAALEQRHLQELSFAEVRRGAEALSRTYVTRGERLQAGHALQGRGKRAAFALLYAPLHFITVAYVVDALRLSVNIHHAPIVDIGCGTGVASAAWALAHGHRRPSVVGVDTNAWAVAEAKWNWRQLSIAGKGRVGRAERVGEMQAGGIVAAFVINELPQEARVSLLAQMEAAHARGTSILLVEPVAKGVAPFWQALATRWKDRGGVEREHRFEPKLPERLALLRRASKRASHELTARSLSLQGDCACRA